MYLISYGRFVTLFETVFFNLQMSTLRMIVLLNFGGFCTIVLLTHLLAEGEGRVKLLGWICVVFATSVFAAPLSIIVSILLDHNLQLSYLFLISHVTCY